MKSSRFIHPLVFTAAVLATFLAGCDDPYTKNGSASKWTRYPAARYETPAPVNVTKHPEWRRSKVASGLADEHYLQHWAGDLDLGTQADQLVNAPVTNVSWFAARAYCAAIGRRLPTHDEWEFAARADATRIDASTDPAFLVGDLQRIESALGADAAEVGFVFVTIDPVRDTPAKMARFAATRKLDSARWTLLSGSAESVRELAVTMAYKYQQVGDDFAHSNLIAVIDASGTVIHREEALGADIAPAVTVVRKLLTTR